MNNSSADTSGDFKTPPRRQELKKPLLCRTPIQIPPSPMLEQLGYGTGVNVFKVNRRAPGSQLLSSPWAIKRLRQNITDSSLSKRLENEAEILRRLNHPNIVGFRGIQKQEDGRLCLAMEEGGSALMDLIEARNDEGFGPFPVPEILQVALHIARALCYLHEEHHLLHCDIKSQNILIKGNFEVAKLCDFGTSVAIGLDGTATEQYNCSQPWTPPEVLLAEMEENSPPITAKADIFSFGLVLWEMMALCVPHMQTLEDEESFNEENFDQSLGTRPELPEGTQLDSSYNSVLSVFYCCTEEKQEKRPTARQLVQILETAIEELGTNTEGTTKV